jgi:hypothetical protein
MQKLMAQKIDYDVRSETEVLSGTKSSQTFYKQRRRNMSQYVFI